MLLFKVKLDQAMFMNVTTVWTWSNRLGSLALNKAPGEDISELTLEASEIARELEGSGNATADLINLASKPHAKGNNEMFKTHVLGLNSQIMKGQVRRTIQGCHLALGLLRLPATSPSCECFVMRLQLFH